VCPGCVLGVRPGCVRAGTRGWCLPRQGAGGGGCYEVTSWQVPSAFHQTQTQPHTPGSHFHTWLSPPPHCLSHPAFCVIRLRWCGLCDPAAALGAEPWQLLCLAVGALQKLLGGSWKATLRAWASPAGEGGGKGDLGEVEGQGEGR
jgi:hypothetical protein